MSKRKVRLSSEDLDSLIPFLEDGDGIRVLLKVIDGLVEDIEQAVVRTELTVDEESTRSLFQDKLRAEGANRLRTLIKHEVNAIKRGSGHS